jgi:uncharacterized HhH-GPD family protein
MRPSFHITGDPDSDRLLHENGLALLIGMLLDQQVPMEWAFRGPVTLRNRLGHLDPNRIAAMDLDDFVSVCCAKPAIHRYPAVMARRIHGVSIHLVEVYDGDASRLWLEAGDAAELFSRLRGLPGFGDEKTRIFIALLAKRYGVRPTGWESAAAPFSDDTPRSAADVDGPDSLAEVKTWKAEQRARGKTKQD